MVDIYWWMSFSYVGKISRGGYIDNSVFCEYLELEFRIFSSE